MTTNAIQGLVTGALLGDEYEETPIAPKALAEIASESINESLLLVEGRELESFLTDSSLTSDPDTVRNRIARYGAMYLSSGGNRGYYHHGGRGLNGSEILIMALDYAEAPNKEKVETARERVFRDNNNMEANQLTRSTASAIEYLEEIWADELVSRLAAYTDTKAPTVRKWVKDQSNPSSSSGGKILEVARAMFELQAGCGMTREEAVRWWDAPNPNLGGDSPHEKVSDKGSWGWALNSDVKKAIGEAGGGIGYREV